MVLLVMIVGSGSSETRFLRELFGFDRSSRRLAMRAEDGFRKGCWGSVGFELWDVNREQASQDGWSV